MKEKNSALSVLEGISAGLEKTINFFSCIFLSVIALSVVIQIFGRTVNIPVVWLGELSTYCLIWVVFFGLAIGYKHGLFAQVDIITHVVPKSWHKYLSIFWDVAGLVIMGAVLWSARDYIAQVYRAKTTSPELRFPLYIVYMGPILGYIFTSWFTLVNIVKKTLAIKSGKGRAERGAQGC